MNKEEFEKALKELNIELDQKQKWQFNRYYELLSEWNKKINLTRIIEENEVYLKHFYDSATICKIINLNDIDNLCDFGTGAGFPGIVIKILFPNLDITLVDSLNKRINFLNNVIEKLDLKKIETIHSRVEDYAKNNREKFDVVVARAVANLNLLLEYSIPMVKCGKYFISMKGNIDEELEKSRSAQKKLNTILLKRESFLLPKEESVRNILMFRKEMKTNIMYPRNSSQIKKSSL